MVSGNHVDRKIATQKFYEKSTYDDWGSSLRYQTETQYGLGRETLTSLGRPRTSCERVEYLLHTA